MPLTVQVGAGPFSFRSACLLPHYLFPRSGNKKIPGLFYPRSHNLKTLVVLMLWAVTEATQFHPPCYIRTLLGGTNTVPPVGKGVQSCLWWVLGSCPEFKILETSLSQRFICTEARARKALSRTKTTFQTEVYNRPLEGLSPPPDKKAAEIP